MKIIDARSFSFMPGQGWLNAIAERPSLPAEELESTVQEILQEVKAGGDEAIRRYSRRFDKVELSGLEISQGEIAEAEKLLPADLKKAIEQAASNIERFHRAQLAQVEKVETMPGLVCWRKPVAIEKVGFYIPGGTAPLFSTVLMLGIPAALAGCRQTILCSPPGPGGKLDPAILYAAGLVGISKIFRVGGVQAIAGMAYGTASIPRVDKIFGPGNQYVTCAKQLIQKQGVAIDMPAGPSELAVFADNSAEPAFVAADLLSQAEHGRDSQVLLVCLSEEMAANVKLALGEQLKRLPRKAMAASALEHSRAVVVNDSKEAMLVLNQYAPEHLILACTNSEELANEVVHAGSVFLGHYAPESLGDYASGTNHILPTQGYSRAYSGVSVDSFVRKITFQHCTKEGLGLIGTTVRRMAEAEGLEAHANAVLIRETHDAGSNQPQ
jgi:histidinol dehydrogenase